MTEDAGSYAVDFQNTVDWQLDICAASVSALVPPLAYEWPRLLHRVARAANESIW